MSRFIFFLTLGFIYLALLHSYSPHERQIIDVKDHIGLLKEINSTQEINPNHPYSFILTDVYKEGVFIKTRFIKIKTVSPFHDSSFSIYKVNSSYYHYLKPYIGYEILHQAPEMNYPQNTVLPPGFSFVGNPILGYWKKSSGEKNWAFYRFYKDLYSELAWETPIGNYRPTVPDYRSVRKLSVANKQYQIDYPKPEKLNYTRQRDNIFLSESRFYGARGAFTPYLAPSFIERLNREQWTSMTNLFSSYYDIFFRPLQGASL